MIKKLLGVIFVFHLLSGNASAEAHQRVEIFDINKRKSVMTVETNDAIQHHAEKYLQKITGVYVKFNPIPKNGYMVKVPLEPNVLVKNQWFHGLVNEVIVIFPKQEKPYLLLFDDENSSYFLNFDGETERFLALLGLGL